MTDEIIEKNITVTLCVSDDTGVLHLEQVGGQTLGKLLTDLALVGDYPIVRQIAQRDLVGQEIFIVSETDYFRRLTGAFSHMSWKSIKSFPDFSHVDSVKYSFIVSF